MHLALGLALLAPGPLQAILHWKDASTPAATAHGLVDLTFGTDAGPDTKFIFLTHHKTGTNLIQRLCNTTALTVSRGTEQCHWCLEIMGQNFDGSLRCPPDVHAQHGPYRGTVGRFTMISSVETRHLKYLKDWAGDYRIVHMVRDPVSMIASDYGYNMGLYRKNRTQDLWDASFSRQVYEASMEDRLRANALVMSRHVDFVCTVKQATQSDPHVLQMDLDAFQSNYTAASRRMFKFLLGRNHSDLDFLVKASSEWDLNKNKRLRGFSFVSNHSETADVAAKIRQMAEAQDKHILSSSTCKGAAESRPWAKHIRYIPEVLES